MDANDEHLLIVGTIEDADPASLRQAAGRAPKKIMLQFFRARLLETANLAAFGIDPGHDVLDGAVLAGSVHSLKNQQQRIVIGRVVKALQGIERLDVFLEEFLVPLLLLADGLHTRRPLLEVDLLALLNTEILRFDFHLRPFDWAI